MYARALEMVAQGSEDAGYLLELYATAISVEQEDAAGSQRALEQALEIATRSGDKHLETRVLRSLGAIRIVEGDYRGAIELGLKALELTRETDQPLEEIESRHAVAMALICLGDPDAATRHLEAALSLQEQFGGTLNPWGQYWIALLRGDLAKVGELGEAKEALEYVVSAAPENLAAIRSLAEIHSRQGAL